MPGFLFHVGALMNCAHPPGLATIPAPKQARVRVGGLAVAVATDFIQVAGCALTPTGTPPDTSVRWVGLATRVRVAGQPVLLQSRATGAGDGLCIGSPPPPPPPNVVAMQQRVKGI